MWSPKVHPATERTTMTLNMGRTDRPGDGCENIVGRVIDSNGRTVVTRIESGPRRLHPDDGIYRGDVIESRAGSWLTLAFDDGTEVTLGAHARMSLDRYFFDETNGSGVLDAWMLAGAFYVSSGVMTSHPNSIVALRTPNANLKLPPPGGVIAGKFIDNDRISLFSLLTDDFGRAGNASVTSNAGSVNLTMANQTTVVSDEGKPPSPPVILTRLDLFDLFGLFRDRGWRYSGIASGRLKVLGAEIADNHP